MRRFVLTTCGVAAGLAVLTACGTTVVGHPVPAPAGSATELAHLVSSQTIAKHTVHIQYHAGTSVGAVTGTGDAEFAAGATDLRMTENTRAARIDMVIKGGTLYLKPPRGLVNAAKPWVRIDPNGTDRVSVALNALVSEEQQNGDPSGILNQISALATITQRNVDQGMTHYRLTADTAKLFASKAVTPQLRMLIGGLGVRMQPATTYDVWINSANLPVRLAFSETTAVGRTGARTTIAVDITYTDWGKPVTIQAPPADQIGPVPTH